MLPARSMSGRKLRYSLLVAITALLMAVALSSPTPPQAHAAPSPAEPIPGRLLRDGIQGTGIKAEGEALEAAKKGLKLPTPNTRTPSQQEIRTAALDDAFKRGQASQAGEQVGKLSYDQNGQPTARSLQAAAVPPTTWPDQIPEADAQECLDHSEARNAFGRTLNRWTWCQDFKVIITYSVPLPDGVVELHGSISVDYQAMVLGSYSQRGARVYWRAKPGTLKKTNFNTKFANISTSSLNLGVIADCGNANPPCSTMSSGVTRSWADWDHVDTWHHWDLSSPVQGEGDEKVAYHPWRFKFSGSGGGYTVLDFVGTDRTLRCDSATYIQTGGTYYPQGCITYNVIPRIQYFLNSTAHSEVAYHIRDAQSGVRSITDAMYPTTDPTAEPKDIPGKFVGFRDGRHLNRIPDSHVQKALNLNEKNRACNSNFPYELNGHPWYDTTIQDCDEYPFQSTLQGAASQVYDFTVRAVNLSHNRSAGASLNYYYYTDRILYELLDQFWVEIKAS